MSDEITNAVIVERIDGLKTIMNEKFEVNASEHQKIVAQTTRTNGSIRRHDKILWSIGGGLTIVSMIIVPMMIYFVNSYWGTMASHNKTDADKDALLIRGMIQEVINEQK